MMLLYGCGLRIGEALSLTPGDVRAARSGSVRVTGKGGVTRIVPVLPQIVEGVENLYEAVSLCRGTRINRYFAAQKEEFLQPSILQKAMRKMRSALGLPETANAPCIAPLVLLHICWRAVAICAQFRNCWDMPAFRLRKFTRKLTVHGCWMSMKWHTPGPEKPVFAAKY